MRMLEFEQLKINGVELYHFLSVEVYFFTFTDQQSAVKFCVETKKMCVIKISDVLKHVI